MDLTRSAPSDPLKTLPGLMAHLTAPRTDLPTYTWEQYIRLPEVERAAYNDQRIYRMKRELTVNTPPFQAAVAEARRLLRNNADSLWGRKGLMLSGPAHVGKTHTAMAILQATFNRYRLEHPDSESSGRIPVVFIEVPPAATAKGMMWQFCHFLQLPQGPRYTLEELSFMAMDAMSRGATTLIVVDEVHNLSNGTAITRDAIRALKILYNTVPATFIYAGVNLETNGLLMGEEGMQIAGRFMLRRLNNYSLSSTEDITIWNDLIGGLEKGVGLINDGNQSLEELATYLYDRTAGSIGSLVYLLRNAAMDLMLAAPEDLPRGEVITKAHLDSITLDLGAERAGVLDDEDFV